MPAVAETQELDQMPIGRIVSLLRQQGCRGYAPLDTEHLRPQLQALRSQASKDYRGEVRRLWRRLKRRLRRSSRGGGRRDAAGRSRSRRRRSRGRSGASRSASGGSGSGSAGGRRRRRRRGGASSSGASGSCEDSKESESEKGTLTQMEAAVDDFIAENNVDEDAARYLRRSAEDAQAYAISCGTLSLCKNPSSALMRRLMDFKRSKELGIAARPFLSCEANLVWNQKTAIAMASEAAALNMSSLLRR
eukprot:TRINITY_DN72299_c0_g1_i1.p1 TRINITY_DN72299_c0_g1~~TRINITY_DN72299_c0_g1_i1.p1  ORF type:complete len:248 (-),score=49.02 TRINITY_DN72299_c0_g1_i1:34-777(-)